MVKASVACLVFGTNTCDFASKFEKCVQLFIYPRVALHIKHGVLLKTNFFLPTICLKFCITDLVHLLALQVNEAFPAE